MAEFEIYVLPGPFEALIDAEEQIFPESAIERVDEIWNKEFQKRQGQIYNGKILQFVSANISAITLAFVDYKFLFAQMKDEKLRHLLHIRPVSVSGMTVSYDKFLVGKRAGIVSSFPKYYELAPSGSVDIKSVMESGKIDFEKALLKELQEETGFQKESVVSVNRWILVHDTKRDIFEFCAKVTLKPEISILQNPKKTKEYERMMWFTKEDLFEHVLQHKENYVPLTLFLLKRWVED